MDDIQYAQVRTAISDFSAIKGNSSSQSSESRVYLITDFYRTIFAGVDFTDAEIERIVEYIRSKMVGCPRRFRAKPEYVTTIYIFKNDKLFFVHDVYPAEMSQIINTYYKKDIIIHDTI